MKPIIQGIADALKLAHEVRETSGDVALRAQAVKVLRSLELATDRVFEIHEERKTQ